MDLKLTIQKVEEFAFKSCERHDGGHDRWHLDRVRRCALSILEKEGNADRLIVEIASLLHDYGDSKFSSDYDRANVSDALGAFLRRLDLEEELIREVIFINRNISFSKGKNPGVISGEFMIVQDADRLDAIGAIGIARAFNYGGFRNNLIYEPSGSEPSTISHFHEKLLKLKNMMNTETGRRLAADRHRYLEEFLERFHKEWKGEK